MSHEPEQLRYPDICAQLSGGRGTVIGIRDVPERAIDIAWDDGSALSILPSAGDRIRKLPHRPSAQHPARQPRRRTLSRLLIE